MADFEKVVRKHVNDDGSIPADSVPALVQAIGKYVGENFVSVDRYNAKKNLADELQTKLDEGTDMQSKYDKLKGEFDTYKTEQEAKQTRADKEAAYRDILRGLHIPEKRFAAIIKATDLDSLKLKDGKFEDADKIKDSAKTEWSDFIVSESETGIDSATPPAGNTVKSTKTKEEIMAIKDTSERQKEIAAHHELFGF